MPVARRISDASRAQAGDRAGHSKYRLPRRSRSSSSRRRHGRVARGCARHLADWPSSCVRSPARRNDSRGRSRRTDRYAADGVGCVGVSSKERVLDVRVAELSCAYRGRPAHCGPGAGPTGHEGAACTVGAGEPVKFHKVARWEQAEPVKFHKVALGLLNGRIEVVSDHSYAETSGDRSRFIRDAVLVVGAEDVRRLASLRAAERDAKARFRGSHESHERTRLDHARHSANLTALYERHTACFNRLLHWRPPISGAERSALGYREALGWRLSHTIEVGSRLRCNGSCRRPCWLNQREARPVSGRLCAQWPARRLLRSAGVGGDAAFAFSSSLWARPVGSRTAWSGQRRHSQSCPELNQEGTTTQAPIVGGV